MWPTTTLTLSDLPRTVHGHPLASAGVCGGCYSPSYSPVKGGCGCWVPPVIACWITSLAWREAVAPCDLRRVALAHRPIHRTNGFQERRCVPGHGWLSPSDQLLHHRRVSLHRSTRSARRLHRSTRPPHDLHTVSTPSGFGRLLRHIGWRISDVLIRQLDSDKRYRGHAAGGGGHVMKSMRIHRPGLIAALDVLLGLTAALA
jgi:hypothetical protein